MRFIDSFAARVIPIECVQKEYLFIKTTIKSSIEDSYGKILCYQSPIFT